jgi:8-oxo-dGTP pyrophosphatase MutT (NUDIX family)
MSAYRFTGVIVFVDDRLVLTLNGDWLPDDLGDGTWLRVGGVGGGCEPGETLVDCALREAQEELSVPVELVSSPVTYAADGTARLRVPGSGGVVPFAADRRGQVSGAVFLGRIDADPRPGDDVEALLLIAPAYWALLEQEPTLGEMREAGARLVERRPLPASTRLWVHPEEGFREVVPLLRQHPELARA